jgi:hypothetical protein
MNIHSNANPNKMPSANAATEEPRPACSRKPTAKPLAVVTASDQASRPESGHGSTRHDRRPGNGQRTEPVEEAVLDVLGHARGRAATDKQDGGGDKTRDQEVNVTQPSGADGAPEHVAKDKQEEGALDGAQDDQLG